MSGARKFRAQKDVRAWRNCRDDFRDYLFELMKRARRVRIRLQFSAFRTFYRFLANEKTPQRSGANCNFQNQKDCRWF
jgi:hypothetical protein